MNVLHITSAKTWRGGERQVFYLIEGLNHEGDSVFLMSPNGSALSERVGSLVQDQLHFGIGVFNLYSNIRKLAAFCKKHQIDVVHGHDSHAHTLLWMSYRFGGLQVKSVVSRRLSYPIKSKSINKYNYPKINKIICVSEFVLAALSPEIEDQSRLKVIHSGVDLESEYQTQKIDDGTFTIGYVAAFTEEKDHKTFINTAKEILKTNSNVQFLLIGDGPLLEVAQNSVLDHNDKFEFTGFVKDVDAEYAKMDLLLHTSKSEALGTAILDGMKFGLPIVATNVGGIPEMVKEGENGFLRDKGDFIGLSKCVSKILIDSDLYDSCARLSKMHVIKFHKDRMIYETMKIYSEIQEM